MKNTGKGCQRSVTRSSSCLPISSERHAAPPHPWKDGELPSGRELLQDHTEQAGGFLQPLHRPCCPTGAGASCDGLRGRGKPRRRSPHPDSVTFPLAARGLEQEQLRAGPRRRSALCSACLPLEGASGRSHHGGGAPAPHGHLRPTVTPPRPVSCSCSKAETPQGPGGQGGGPPAVSSRASHLD